MRRSGTVDSAASHRQDSWLKPPTQHRLGGITVHMPTEAYRLCFSAARNSTCTVRQSDKPNYRRHADSHSLGCNHRLPSAVGFTNRDAASAGGIEEISGTCVWLTVVAGWSMLNPLS